MKQISQVRIAIHNAKAHELRTRQFAGQLRRNRKRTHRLIRSSADHPLDSLMSFVTDYVELVPTTMEYFAQHGKLAETQPIDPFIQTALGYFFTPSILVTREAGLNSALVSAYQAHRLFEEMCNAEPTLAKREACRIETVQANLVAHYLIGEPFANEMDEAVEATSERLMREMASQTLVSASFLRLHRSQWWWLWQRWRTLFRANHIQFRWAYR